MEESIMKTVANKTISFDQVMKVFKKYVATNDFRKILQNVYFDGEHLIATDSHTLLRVNKNYISDIPEGMQEGSLFDPKKMGFASDSLHSYPETSRLIPNFSNSTVSLNKNNIKELHNHIKEAKKAAKEYYSPIKFNFYQSYTEISAQDSFTKGFKEEHGENYRQVYEELVQIEKEQFGKNPPELSEYHTEIESIYVEGEELIVHVNPKYINDALMTVKKLSKLSSNDVKILMTGKMQPIQFKQEEVFDILVLPIRI
jgi:hypothetical protein